MTNLHRSGRYLVGFLACAGFFVAGMAVDRCFANPVVAEAQAPTYVGISGENGIYVLKSNGDVEYLDRMTGDRVIYSRAGAKVETNKERDARFRKQYGSQNAPK